ncbi:hypothetical protein DFH08DRAFT_849965 [Mycena albidolilacea]|uniref:F-box domain-containing protein n=1 Tax=Mycena albidolilacea TaxID=1033008 RepID=A0AAD7AEP0_9AGAR|nr:hypothetical protein DFH08DRAFT_849965 [Mycena albidolilacea]
MSHSVLSLPNELLVAIAVAGQQDRIADLNSETQSTTFKSEWTWSHVSQRFRDVVVGAPELWALIETDFGSEGSVEILKLYLERSRACQISVTLHEPSGSHLLEEGLLDRRVTRDIVPQINRIRWLRIVLTTMNWEHEEMLPPFRDVAAPCLQHLEVVSTDHDAGTDALFLSGAPRLSSLKIDGITLRLPAPAWTATLTHFDYSSGAPDIDSLAAITAQCPLLVHLRLRINYVAPDTNRFHIPTLSFLHIFISDDGGADYLPRVVDLFHSPALTKFIVHGSHGDQIALLLSLKSLPHSSFPALTSLAFLMGSSQCSCDTANHDHPSHSISSPPGIFPALSHLTLINQCYTSDLIRDILGPASQPWPLKTITLGVKNISFDGVRGVIEDAVVVKRQHGGSLPTVQLGCEPAWSLANWKEDISWDVEISW